MPWHSYTYTKEFNVWIWLSFSANIGTGFPLITMNNKQWLGPVLNRSGLETLTFKKGGFLNSRGTEVQKKRKNLSLSSLLSFSGDSDGNY